MLLLATIVTVASVWFTDKIDHYDVRDFWEPLPPRGDRKLILDPGEFYILASSERIHIPPELAAEMVAIDPSMGEFRVHYAGFFDPGFGFSTTGFPGRAGHALRTDVFVELPGSESKAVQALPRCLNGFNLHPHRLGNRQAPRLHPPAPPRQSGRQRRCPPTAHATCAPSSSLRARSPARLLRHARRVRQAAR